MFNPIDILFFFVQQLLYSMERNLWPLLSVLAFVWTIQLVNVMVGYRLNYLGVIPRKWYGLPGIFLSPLLHGNWTHILLNSLFFFILGIFWSLGGLVNMLHISVFITSGSGALTWLFAREAIHVGASGLIMGYWGYFLVSVYFSPNVVNIAIVIICFFYFGGLFSNLMPGEKGVSWEGHVFGFITGIISYFYYPFVPTYSYMINKYQYMSSVKMPIMPVFS